MAGWRCAECVGCGRCLEAWGLTGSDATSGATNWADAFKALDDGSAGAPPPCPAPAGVTRAAADGIAPAPGVPDAATGATPTGAREAARAGGGAPDAATGATPGVSAACRELGLDSLEAVVRARGIRPPGC